MKNNQSGRSMVEMLGVLAIIGVLSAGGLAGYSKAMFKHKLNNTMDQITMLVTNIRTMYGTQGNYEGLGNVAAVNLGIVPSTMIAGHTEGRAPKTNGADDAGQAEAYALSNPFKGSVSITTVNARDLSKTDTPTGFKVEYTGLPTEACINLATADFGSGAGSGFIGVGIASDKTSTGIGNNEGNPYEMDDAIDKCNATNNNATVTWYFY